MLTAIATLASMALVAPVTVRCPSPDPQAVTATVQAMFDAAATGDSAKLASILVPGFYAFDVGRRYDAVAFQTAMLAVHRSSKQMTWQVTAPDVHFKCDTAWVAYINRGTISESGAVTSLTWLESAELVYFDQAWHLLFLNSGRANSGA